MGLLSRRGFVASLSAALAVSGQAVARIAAADLERVRRVAIHPAVGVARVGNSRDAFFFAPETPDGAPSGPFKDPTGAVAKQAARFRLFGYDADGRVVGELTAREAEVSWRLDVANAKAAWYEVDVAFDVEGVPAAALRNAGVADRARLVVRATPRTLSGASAGPVPLDGGRFQDMPVTLGEVMTDGDARLVVLPGSGAAHAGPGAPPMNGFANNDGWVDDLCDGPVRATVQIGGRTFEADPGWLVCAPPNYVPGVASSLVTAYDAVESALVDAGVRVAPQTVFERDVWPIFRRMSDLQWVNEGFAQRYGFGAPFDWTDAGWRARLADASAENAPTRAAIFARFRDPAFADVQEDAEPQLYGDKAGVPSNTIEPRQWLALTPLQYRHLGAWAEGRFTRGAGAAPARLEDVPPQERPAALDRAALDACVGGPFHPGIELPWIVRTTWIWTRDMRIASPAPDVDRTDYGAALSAPVALSRSGPLSRLGPGGVTQWLGVPWHADASSCRFGYEEAFSPILPGFWPARIPNGVLAEIDYEIVVDLARSLDERRAAFGRRRDWERFISAPTRPPILASMAQDWFRLGMVTERPGAADGAFPAMKVETGVGFAAEPETLYPPGAIFPQIGRFPLVTSNSDDDSLRLVAADATVSVLKLSAPLERPEGLTRGLDGAVYVCCMDGDVVRRVTPQGEVSLFADRSLKSPVGIAGDRRGNFYVANYTPQGFVTALGPTGESRVLVPPEAGLAHPVGVIVTPDGALLVTWGGSSVARIDPASGTVLDPHWISGLTNPRQMAFDRSQRLHVAVQDGTIRRYDLLGTPLPLTLRGADLAKPFGLAFDRSGLLYATTTGGDLVKRIRIEGDVGVVSDFAAGLRNGGGIALIG